MLTFTAYRILELWLSRLGAQSRTQEVLGSNPADSYSCEDGFALLNPQGLRGLYVKALIHKINTKHNK